MPKMKSHRGACKRFKTTSSGKIKRERMNGSVLEQKPRTPPAIFPSGLGP